MVQFTGPIGTLDIYRITRYHVIYTITDSREPDLKSLSGVTWGIAIFVVNSMRPLDKDIDYMWISHCNVYMEPNSEQLCATVPTCYVT